MISIPSMAVLPNNLDFPKYTKKHYCGIHGGIKVSKNNKSKNKFRYGVYTVKEKNDYSSQFYSALSLTLSSIASVWALKKMTQYLRA